MEIIKQLPDQFKAIIGVLVGLITGFTTMMLLRSALSLIPAEGIGIERARQYNEWVSTLSTDDYLKILVVFCVSAVVAGAVSGFFVLHTRYKIASIVTGFLLLVLTIGNFLAFNHPEWLSYAACIGYMVFSWLGGWLIRKIFP